MDDRVRRTSKSERSDLVDEGRVAGEVSRALDRTGRPWTGHLEVSTSDDVVRLRGRVASYYQKQVAQTAALRIIGSRQLVNELEVP